MKFLCLAIVLLPTFANAATLSSDQLSCTITENGIQSISLAGRVITTKPSPGFPAHQGFYTQPGWSPDPDLASFGTPTTTLSASPESVTIHDTFSNATADYTYRVTGNDIELQMLLNDTGSTPLTNLTIALPTFAFANDVAGDMRSWDPSYLRANPLTAHHPGTWCPLAVSYARDSNYGIALHCKTHFDKQSLFDAYIAGVNNLPPKIADLTLYLWDALPPGQKLKINIILHITAQTDLPSLLSSYIRDFQAFAGPMRYQPDDRPWLRFTSFDKAFVTKENPLGFNGDIRRFDKPAGISRFEDMVYPSLDVTQGTIFWQPQGYNPRGCQYRNDFDVWPKSIADNLPALIQWYQSNGLKFGFCAPPGKFITPAGPDSDTNLPIDPNNSAQMAALLARFDKVQKLGVCAYYMDDFGADLRCYQIIKQIRSHIGPAIPSYTEFTSDLMLPYSGVYTELNSHGPNNSPPDGGTLWYSPDTLAIFRLLYPQSGIMAAKIDAGAGRPVVSAAQLAQWKLTPVVEDFQARQYRPYFSEFVKKYLQNNIWK